ncbi:hypothetical protein ACNTMW_25905 [Planosporangium sp. 12N6]|uniref:DivIVA domain-containing protein n=1 Tax=Planosporangium spinosum TaxID=3402278 RepID=UPI003CE90C47
MDQSPARAAVPAAVPETTGEDVPLVGEEADLNAYSTFDGALRGYDRRQVNKYVTRTQRRIEELTAELAGIRRNEQVLTARLEDLSKANAMCTCDPNKPESAVLGARLRQIIDIATTEADDVRTRAEAETRAMREEAESALVSARQQAEQASSALEAMLAHRRAAEEATLAERRAAVEGWSQRHVAEARDTARRVIERAAAVSGQVIASARWLVDALGAHRDALAEQLGGVQRRIDELPSLEAATAVNGENLARIPTDEQPAGDGAGRQPGPAAGRQPGPAAGRPAAPPTGRQPAPPTGRPPAPAADRQPAPPTGRPPAHAADRSAARSGERFPGHGSSAEHPDESGQSVRAVVRVPPEQAAPPQRAEGPAWGPNVMPPRPGAGGPPAGAAGPSGPGAGAPAAMAGPPAGMAGPPGPAAGAPGAVAGPPSGVVGPTLPADMPVPGRTWAPVNPRIGGAHRG